MNFLVLQALVCGEGHGYEIGKRILAATSGLVRIGAGTLYPALQRLHRDGLIEETQGADHPNTGRRTVYQLTRLGEEAAADQREEVRAVLDSLQDMAPTAEPEPGPPAPPAPTTPAARG